jgi:formyl-CoA transferase
MPELVEHPAYKTNSTRLRNRDALKHILNEKFATRGKMEWTLDLVRLGLPAGPILSLDQALADPQVTSTGMVEEVEHPRLGKLRVLANPIRMDGTRERSVRTPPPPLGADSRQVLQDWGIPGGDIEALVDGKVVMHAG